MKKIITLPLAAIFALGVLGACDTGTDAEVETGTVDPTPATTTGDMDMATQTPASDTATEPGTEPGAVADDSVTNQESPEADTPNQQNTTPEVDVSTTQPM